MHDSRPGDRTPVHYAMKAPARHSPAASASQTHSPSHNHHTNTHSHHHNQGHSHTQVQTPRNTKTSKSTTPLASPRGPFSVGQSHPPMISPALASHPTEKRSSSPNYFGLVVDPSESRELYGVPRDNWSPASSVKSFGASLPKPVSLQGNLEYEAFKRQADLNRGESFAMSTTQHQPTSNPTRPRPPRWHTHASDVGSESPFGRSFRDRPASRMDVDQDKDATHDSAYVSADSKRNSASSAIPSQITSMPRFESPRPMDPNQNRTTLTRAEDRDPRLSVMEHKVDPPSPGLVQPRAATLPTRLEGEQPHMLSGAELKDLTETVDEERILLLDIRSSQNFAMSRIKGALNLCIPTTLLKRASFNIHKLQQTFQSGPESSKFSSWQDMHWIVVYDAHTSDKRDAVTAQNMIKKFTNEGFAGNTGILRGGFVSIQDSHPEIIDRRSAAELASKSNSHSRGGGLAPVIGGVTLPTSSNDANPFFSNIRQNMDLADGVGQFDVARPSGLESPALPQWLRQAASEPDHGKRVSEKFLRIELDEQSRMKSAYAAFNPNNADRGSQVQLCGVEKGGKNRYKDILPFEHARVHLQSKPEGACDYVNASHLTASRSNKRYIASQGPLPATFEDFWSVVWEQDVRVVVMLTAESEGGQLKCHPYWNGRDFGPIHLSPLSEKKVSLDIDKHRSNSSSMPPPATSSESGRRRANTTTANTTSTSKPQAQQGQSAAPYVTVRKFALSCTSQPFAPIREITHLHFPSWPDFGTPAQPSHLLALVELANIMQRSAMPIGTSSLMNSGNSSTEPLSHNWHDEPEANSRARPMLVHCSAGCGRTGAFCTVDSVIDMLKRQKYTPAPPNRGQDSEGDVSMADFEEVVSPHSNQEKRFNLSPVQAVTPRKRKSQESVDLDKSWLQNEDVDLIQKTVEEFREQRLSMVQSLRQYVLCYETILEWASRANDRGTAGMSGSVSSSGTRARSGSLKQARRDV